MNSPNGTFIVCFAVFAILIGVLLSKHGLLTVHTKSVSIGAVNQEHDIMNRQMQWLKDSVNAFESFIPKEEGYDKWRGRCVCRLVYEEMVDWILFNHIVTTDKYISLKQERVWNIVLSNTVNDKHRSEEFKQAVYDNVADTIKDLVAIRQEYTK